ncbi:hypothetical protein [Pedobacter heparinus]|uniref:DUF4468 domain-containing protein n=1 Tax=Pedobacter heparinus (strain ATCC 13125 / DSM 2366 / CIP 104194 / JCM 7457 / NBRC 12017 / NCIMB 9290 / NRRL B-14731 / HIM 762-3) TaxID=485917 RepID=C6Y1G4_PEDHD|nr:hypothetical protein [Pedobacter heparinus]ACU02940.1 hypothetical protein Phep_0718 [Pedobacter heparinus DSM 2366]
MKRIMLLVLFMPLMGLSQIKTVPAPVKKNPIKKQLMDSVLFKGVNKLLIENDKSVNQNLFLLQTALVNRGYQVSINRKLFRISTKDSIIEGGRAAYVFNGQINANSIELSGKYNLKAVTSILGESDHIFKYDIEYSGAEKALSKKLFALLMEIANDIHGKKIYIDETRKKRGTIF